MLALAFMMQNIYYAERRRKCVYFTNILDEGYVPCCVLKLSGLVKLWLLS